MKQTNRAHKEPKTALTHRSRSGWRKEREPRLDQFVCLLSLSGVFALNLYWTVIRLQVLWRPIKATLIYLEFIERIRKIKAKLKRIMQFMYVNYVFFFFILIFFCSISLKLQTKLNAIYGFADCNLWWPCVYAQ